MMSTINDYQRFARPRCSPDLIKSLRTFRSLPVVLGTGIIWIEIMAAWAIALVAPPPLWILSFVLIAAAIQGMATWIHEASHYSLFRDRKLNDLWTNVFLAGPIGASVEAYRRAHMTHHAGLASERDMDSYAFKMDISTPAKLAWEIAKGLTGILGLKAAYERYLKGRLDSQTERQGAGKRGAGFAPYAAPIMTVGFNLALLALCVIMGRWYLYALLWAYPIIAVTPTLNMLRSIAEHQPFGHAGAEPPNLEPMRAIVRTTLPGPVEKWLLYRTNFNYHVEHHLYPQVPAHALPLLHEHLKKAGFFEEFPETLQKSGLAKVLRLSAQEPAVTQVA